MMSFAYDTAISRHYHGGKTRKQHESLYAKPPDVTSRIPISIIKIRVKCMSIIARGGGGGGGGLGSTKITPQKNGKLHTSLLNCLSH